MLWVLLLFCSVKLRLSLKLADFQFYISEFGLELPQHWGYRYGATMPDFALGHALMHGCLCSCCHFLSQCELSESRIQVSPLLYCTKHCRHSGSVCEVDVTLSGMAAWTWHQIDD